jgi:signal transduction histidine kinase
MATKLRALMTRRGVDMLVVLGIVGGVVEMIVRRGNESGPKGSLAALIVCMLALIIPFFFWRIAPVVVPMTLYVAAVSISFFEREFITHSYIVFFAAIVAGFLLGMARERALGIAGIAFAYAALSIIVHNDPSGAIGDFVSSASLITMAWFGGFALRQKLQQARAAEERASRLERERELRDFEAAAEERARIARELHDVVAHSVSVMTVQAAAVRRVLRPDQEREREALEVVAQTGREALAEMRRLVGVMKQPEEGPALAPQPSLQHLDRLVENVREAGLEVRLQIEGKPVALPVGIDVSAFRIIQEGLTNTLKHARATSVDVLVHYGTGVVELVVSDDGRANTSGGGGGHGLVGMRERVAVYGGEIAAGPRDGGGYELRARLPVGA